MKYHTIIILSIHLIVNAYKKKTTKKEMNIIQKPDKKEGERYIVVPTINKSDN